MSQRLGKFAIAVVCCTIAAMILGLAATNPAKPVISERAAWVNSVLQNATNAEQAGSFHQAVALLDTLPAHFDDTTIYHAWRKKALLQVDAGRISDAVSTLRTILRHRKNDTSTRRKLAMLLGGCGLRFETVSLLQKNLIAQEIDFNSLVCLAQDGRCLFSQLKLQQMHHRQPTDPLPIIGMIAHSKNHRNDAAKLQWVAKLVQCERLSQLHSESHIAYAVTSFIQQHSETSVAQRTSAMMALLKMLQNEASSHPDGWKLLARWAVAAKDSDLARQSLLQASVRDPFDTEIVHALAESVREDHAKIAAELVGLWRRLKRIEHLAGTLAVAPTEIETMQDLARELNMIGRRAEATEWARCALRHDARLSWAVAIVRDRMAAGKNSPSARWQHPARKLSMILRSPLSMKFSPQVSPSAAECSDATWQSMFQNIATSAGLQFSYDNGAAPEQVGLRMHQWTGGGVGVIDVDRDDYPDLYFVQGGDLLGGNVSDQVFRNVRGRRLQNATRFSNVNETNFGQGIAAGDLNHDGFDDLLIANVGQNYVLLNQGDGTFRSVAASPSHAWTTSVAIADLNDDGDADVYVTNYLGGTNVFDATCNHEGQQRVCGPLDFSAEPDQVLISDGRGNFCDASGLITCPPARGMGVLVGNIDGVAGNEIYVANDETENHLLRLPRSHRVKSNWVETGVRSGVALNQFGQRQGSMGIACTDANNDGLADLFVTNYYSESNTYYSQLSVGTFIDETIAKGLSSDSISMLAFGCQFKDFDNDGDPDLVVANGHLDDFRHLGHPWKMCPQLFGNNGGGQFREVEFRSGYFSTARLGRSVATLDWNSDRRVDMVVTHLDASVALLENVAAPVDRSVSLRLVGTRSARGCAGAIVGCAVGERRQYAWMTAGDGYQCSNEKQLQFAAPTPTATMTITVTWPSGQEQHFTGIPAATRWTIVEDCPVAFERP